MNERNRTGVYPSVDSIGRVTPQQAESSANSIINTIRSNPQMSKDVDTKVKEITNEASTRIDKNSLLGDGDNNLNDYIIDLLERLINNFSSFFKPADYVGNLGDLMGQQIAIEILLFILTVSILLLFTAFIINVILFFNKDYILKKKDILLGEKFNFINYFFKYQFFIIKISLL